MNILNTLTQVSKEGDFNKLLGFFNYLMNREDSTIEDDKLKKLYRVYKILPTAAHEDDLLQMTKKLSDAGDKLAKNFLSDTELKTPIKPTEIYTLYKDKDYKVEVPEASLLAYVNSFLNEDELKAKADSAYVADTLKVIITFDRGAYEVSLPNETFEEDTIKEFLLLMTSQLVEDTKDLPDIIRYWLLAASRITDKEQARELLTDNTPVELYTQSMIIHRVMKEIPIILKNNLEMLIDFF